MDALKVILTHWHGSSKYASWRLIETIDHSECPSDTRKYATKTLLDCLSDKGTSTYAKARLLHYLVRRQTRPNGPEAFRSVDQLSPSAKKRIKQILPGFLAEQAFDLNVITLYTMRAMGAKHAELEAAVREKSPKPVAVPVRNVLILAAEPFPSVQSSDLGAVPEDNDQEEYH